MSSEPFDKTTLVMLIDAFPITYLSRKNTPFLHSLSQHGVLRHIEPLFAFKGIEATMFSGVWPNAHNVWTEFWLRNKNDNWEDTFLRVVTKCIDQLPSDDVRARLRYGVKRFVFRKPHENPNLVPARAMAYFEPSQQKRIVEPGALASVETVFDVFRRKGIRFVFIEPWIQGDRGVLRRARKIMKQNDEYRFWYLKLNILDHLGHKFGPEPSLFSEQLAEMDTSVEEIVGLLRKRSRDLSILVLADHGMSTVHRSLNMLEILSQLKARMYKDYVVFVDSTLIRFWFFAKRARREICELLHQMKYGHILTNPEEQELKIPLNRRYGELIYVLNEGFVLHPCFFHTRSLTKGMHGYAYPKTTDTLPILVADGKIVEVLNSSRNVCYADLAQLILSASISKSRSSASANFHLNQRNARIRHS